MHESVIWDWNGTLLNDVAVNCSILNSMLRKRDLHQIDLNRYRKLFRLPIIEFYHDCGFTFELESFADTALEYFQIYQDKFPSIPLTEGAEETVDNLYRRGIKQYIVSAMSEPELHYQVKEKGIHHYFDGIAGLNDIYAVSKVQRASELVSSLNVKGTIHFIGDIDHDYAVSQAIHAQCILYTKGHQHIHGYANCTLVDDLRLVLQSILKKSDARTTRTELYSLHEPNQ